ncbi:FKBP-type peptidyl-prolyl cis-trans isomerase [Pseudoalteromonas xiamenensis]|uniref:Peptidyl-prolyl cis-trans isomerase n=1 Tax=Pseudoalteromonas xiamenensis TaxID=882626 RepID=A0A975DHE3_9GAMM|nr:FKBP-type peptidyl-prolyl cis-trans isomerase [Pseudoalteromonas xiamenensis]QTH71167.1 FKBP-type peptidyl-prolyl cis-trans isomerase [Pseudoalteromonas xiamenensis]WMN59507.1 FKBP-type peptidyl-prolyl cis-trans isomerase [Pseudoalteromonas xiamenensis]
MSEQVIGANSEVVFHFSVKLSDGSAADSTKVHDKPAKLVMGDGSLTANFEKCLLGLKQGDNKSFELQPQDAFGMPNPDNIYYVDRSKFSVEVEPKVGAIIAFTQPDGTDLPGIVRDVAGDSVTVDFNHPLAGQVVTFEVDILEVKN